MTTPGSMAKKVKSRPSGRFKARATRARSRVRGIGGKIRWGEAALSALVGYFGGTILDSTGAPDMLAANSSLGPYMYDQSIAIKTATGRSDITYGDVVNKDIGFLAIAKVAYDVVKGRSLDSKDMSIYLPYALGTVFDPAGGSGNASSGAW